MAGATRRNFTAEFKAEAGVAALRGAKTLVEIAQTYGTHPTKVTQWKGWLEKDAPRVREPREEGRASSGCGCPVSQDRSGRDGEGFFSVAARDHRSSAERKPMIQRNSPKVSVAQQCGRLG